MKHTTKTSATFAQQVLTNQELSNVKGGAPPMLANNTSEDDDDI